MFVNTITNPDNVRKYNSVSCPLPAEQHQIWPDIFKPVPFVSRAFLEENPIAARPDTRKTLDSDMYDTYVRKDIIFHEKSLCPVTTLATS